MASYIRLQNFITAGREAYDAPQVHHLVNQGHQTLIRPGVARPLNSREFLEQNGQTWNVFLRSTTDVLGATRVQEICRRYRFNPYKMERQGKPLLPQHVEMFSVGASRIMTRDLKRSLHEEGAKLKDLSIAQLSERMRAANPFPMMGWVCDPKLISGAPSKVSAHFIHDPLLMDKETQILLSDVHTLSFFAWRERFSKTLVNRELVEKQIIPAPGDGGRVEYYKVYRKITTGDGLVAYALTPIGNESTLKPILFFRPTQLAVCAEDAIESYANDMQPDIGEIGYLAAKRHLNDLMEDPKFNSQPIEVAGYSLGGDHAQRFLVDHWRKISEATFFNDPSVESELAVQFAQDVNAHAGELAQPLRLNIIRSTGDLATCAGEKHIGWGIRHPNVTVQLLEVDHQNKAFSALDLHAARAFDAPYSGYQSTWRTDPGELDTLLDNEERGPAVFWYEKVRKYWGGVVYAFLCVLREILHLFSDLTGIKILRSSKTLRGS